MIYHRAVSPVTPEWLVLLWRLPTGVSTERVSIWRGLRRLGAASLTPGAAALPYSEEFQEQLDWLAQEVDQGGGDAWVLPVIRLSGDEVRRIREQVDADRTSEYALLQDAARSFLQGVKEPTVGSDFAERHRIDKELLALQRRFLKIRDRDHFSAPGRRETAQMIDRCLAFRQGISRKLLPVTDPQLDPQEAR